jgi:hypothetical protein
MRKRCYSPVLSVESEFLEVDTSTPGLCNLGQVISPN